MQLLIVFSTLLVAAMSAPFHAYSYNYGVATPDHLRYVVPGEIATPLEITAPLRYAPLEVATPIEFRPQPMVPAAFASRFLEPVSVHHNQDFAGQYKFGFATPTQNREEARSIDGATYGTYSYVDANGVTQTVNYHADALKGFTVEATNLPVAPVAPAVPEVEALVPIAETAEVIEARAAHMKAYNDALNGVVAEVSVPVVDAALIPQPVEDEPAVKLAKAEHLALKDKIIAEHAAIAAGEALYKELPVEKIEVAEIVPKVGITAEKVISPYYNGLYSRYLPGAVGAFGYGYDTLAPEGAVEIVPKVGITAEKAFLPHYNGLYSRYYPEALSGAFGYGYDTLAPEGHAILDGRYFNYWKK